METRSSACATNADPENPNMMHTRVGAIGTNSGSVLQYLVRRLSDPGPSRCTAHGIE